MPTTSHSVQTPQAANADGYVQADGFCSPVVAGVPTAPNGGHSKGPAQLPFGFILGAGQFGAYSVSSGLTAHAGGGKASALQLTSQLNFFSTVATAADSALLPPTTAGTSTTPSTVGQFVLVYNGGANAMQLFGSGTDTINGVATGTGVSIAAGKTALLFCNAAGSWVGPVALA